MPKMSGLSFSRKLKNSQHRGQLPIRKKIAPLGRK